jgi:hypothetical protein
MKVLAKPIEVVSWTDEKGDIHPSRFRLKKDDESYSVVKIDKIIFKDKEKLAGNEILIFKCQSVINNQQKLYELKYELRTCKWILWKM